MENCHGVWTNTIATVANPNKNGDPWAAVAKMRRVTFEGRYYGLLGLAILWDVICQTEPLLSCTQTTPRPLSPLEA